MSTFVWRCEKGQLLGDRLFDRHGGARTLTCRRLVSRQIWSLHCSLNGAGHSGRKGCH